MNLTIQNVEITVDRISNSELFTFESEIPEPKVPLYYLEEQQIEIPNPDHPLYHTAMLIYQTGKNISMFDNLLTNYVKLKNIEDIVIPKTLKRTYPGHSDIFLYLRHVVFKDDKDKDMLIDNIALTETRVYNIYSKIKILRNGIKLDEHDLKNIINTRIQSEPVIIGNHQIVHPLDEYNACVTSNISWNSWLRNELPLEIMASTVALFRINKLVDIHSSDAQQIASSKQK